MNPLTRFNYLASPPLVVAYALAGRMDLDLTREPIGIGTDGPVFLRDIWPTPQEVADEVARSVKAEFFTTAVRRRVQGRRAVAVARRARRARRTRGTSDSTYVKNPPYFEGMTMEPPGIRADHRRARARDARRLDHDRPHLAGRQHSGVEPGGQVADRARRREEGLQLVRRAPRQSRSDDARHVRQHSSAQRDGAGHGRRLVSTTEPGGKPRVHLRRVDGATRRPARRSSSSPARSTAPARRATGRPRARCCSAFAR